MEQVDFRHECSTDMRDQTIPVIQSAGPADTANKKAHAALRDGWDKRGQYLSEFFKAEDVLGIGLCDPAKRTVKAQVLKITNSSQASSLIETMGKSAAIRKIQREVTQVALTKFSILVTGESGTGKELVSQAIHTGSQRAGKALVAVDCGAISESLIESELFGHEKGSFTGAHQAKAGAFEMADGGTIFLDEIGNLPMAMQGKLLRVLETHKIRRIGSTKVQSVDFRVVAATNADLQKMIGKRTFRDDLYHRLADYTIHIPALRERKEDLDLLVRRFLNQANAELGKQVKGLSAAAWGFLRCHDCPGNARELRNMLRRAVLMCDDPMGLIGAELLDRRVPELKISQTENQKPAHPENKQHPSCWPSAPEELLILGVDVPLKDMVARVTAQFERAILVRTLALTQGNKAKAARMLHIDYKTMHNKLKTYEISTLQFMKDEFARPAATNGL